MPPLFDSSFNLCLLFKKSHGAKKNENNYCDKKGNGGNDLHSLKPGPGCSKLMTLLVKETLISRICQYFAKASLIFSTKNVSVFVYKVELTS